MKTLILAIGHNWGGGDQGATAFGTTEAIEVKKIVDAVVSQGIPGVQIVKVPERLNLLQKIAWINANYKKYPEAFAMDIHLDSGPSTARGASVWFCAGNNYTESEGRQFLAQYTNITGLPSRHVNPDTSDRLGRLGFVRQNKCASLIIELGFISNQTDLQIIRTKATQAIISSVQAMNTK